MRTGLVRRGWRQSQATRGVIFAGVPASRPSPVLCVSLPYILSSASGKRLVEPMERRAGLCLLHRRGGLVTQGNVLRKWTASHTLASVGHSSCIKVAGHGLEQTPSPAAAALEIAFDTKSKWSKTNAAGASRSNAVAASIRVGSPIFDPLAKHRQAARPVSEGNFLEQLRDPEPIPPILRRWRGPYRARMPS